MTALTAHVICAITKYLLGITDNLMAGVRGKLTIPALVQTVAPITATISFLPAFGVIAESR